MSIIKAGQHIINHPEYGWASFFEENFELIVKIQEVIDRKEGDFYPKPKEVFKIFKKIRPENVKVLILGQDPYPQCNKHGEPIAMGYSFSVRPDSRIPPSLKNIFKVIKQNIGEESQCEEDGDLTPWVEQNIFMLNSCLTVKPGEPASHGNIWLGFIQRTIAHIFKLSVFTPIDEVDSDDSDEEVEVKIVQSNDKRDTLPITLLWGRAAQDFANSCSGHILLTSHPSPLGARHGFLDCDHFKKVNILLKKRGDKEIIW